MRLNKIKLENIRSYLTEEIIFPEGSVLLNGDIGSGKSSVLLAIDFALFGLRKNELTGSSLLRNGADKGSVELTFTIDDKNILIKRNLKRSKTVIQDSGHIIINNEKKQGSPIELKQTILELLNYPMELLTKSKSLIYRYTVYTPQEEMKHILLGDKELRLNTLRKVFDIDKYKNIQENSKIVSSFIKGKIKEFKGFTADLEEKKNKKIELEKNIEKTEEKINSLKPEILTVKENIKECKDTINKIESKITNLNELKNELKIKEVEINNKVEQLDNSKKELQNIEKSISELTKIKQKINIEDLNKQIESKKNEINLLENTLKEISSKVNEFRIKRENAEEVEKSISKLDICPVCKQKVSQDYKSVVITEKKELIKKCEEEIKLYNKRDEEAQDILTNLRKELEKLKSLEREYELNQIKIKSLDEKTEAKNKLGLLQNKLKEDIKNINHKKLELNEEINKFKNLDNEYKGVKKELDLLLEKEKDLEIKKAGFDTEFRNYKELLEQLNIEIFKKDHIKKNLNYLAKIQEWIDGHFTNLINIIERQVMLRVHLDFDSLFQKWFNMLVEDENLNVKLDDEFTPLIDQNGHDIDYLFLSGGEKTAIALAYRLSLNQVINNLISGIKTNDLLVLDEPTDGFSNEQLDKMKDILDEINLKQIIIVSHENKIESFVDNVIKFKKEGHVSRVVR